MAHVIGISGACHRYWVRLYAITILLIATPAASFAWD
jgi:hypothetical protein